MQMKITLLSNQTISVGGIPQDLNVALDILAGASKAVTLHFVGRAKEGKLDGKNRIVQDKILMPDNKLVI
jgi:hypothetical protein